MEREFGLVAAARARLLNPYFFVYTTTVVRLLSTKSRRRPSNLLLIRMPMASGLDERTTSHHHKEDPPTMVGLQTRRLLLPLHLSVFHFTNCCGLLFSPKTRNTSGSRRISFNHHGTSRLFSDSINTSEPTPIDKTSLVWLRTSLRIADNKALREAIKHGSEGLSVVFTWERGPILSTPSAAFECAAVQELDRKLRDLGNHLKVINVDNSIGSSIYVIYEMIETLRPQTVVVDASSSENYHDARELQIILEANPTMNGVKLISITEDGSLLPFACIPRALGRSRTGGRIFRWPTFLSNMSKGVVEKPMPPPTDLPRPLDDKTDALPDFNSAPLWAKNLMERWGEVSEQEAIERARSFGQSGANPTTLGNRGASNKDTKLSPYLRWGLISPRQAYQEGVRKRDLLWRDWSHLCYRRVNPLRQGEPVLPYLDGCCASNILSQRYGEDLFRAWCRGETGFLMVDAGMRQLWCEGWMPRKVRLLAASCLVEGLGLDWRKGRDWFEHTLVDHDPAINELMWQNAGFCGIDLFYRGLKWESVESQEDRIYVERWADTKVHWPSTMGKSGPIDIIELGIVAKSHRVELQKNGQYKAAGGVTNSGVRVIWENARNANEATVGLSAGDVWGVGVVPLEKLRFE
eukprot:scaffold710_cov171-Amphora_coffeaeformis.AAC.6